jgi:hypothetical protein
LAIGDRNPPPPLPRPYWRLKNTAKEAKEHFDDLSDAFKDIYNQSGKYKRDVEEINRSINTIKDAMRKRDMQADERYEEFDATRSKVRRLENIVEQISVRFFLNQNKK